MCKESVKEKILKLLSKTEENGCTPEEAASSLAIAHKLLAEHSLSVSDLSVEDAEEIKEVLVKTDTKSLSGIQVEIASSLASHFGVELLRSFPKGIPTLKVIAEHSRVQIFVEVFKFAYNSFKKSWSSYHSRLNISSSEKASLRISYLRGFMDGMTNEIIRQENEFGLRVVKSEELKEYMSNLNISRTAHYHYTSSRDEVAKAEAFSFGYKDGAFVQRNKNKVIA